VLLMLGCARARPPNVALVARYEMLRSGPQTAVSIVIEWPIERPRLRAKLLEEEP